MTRPCEPGQLLLINGALVQVVEVNPCGIDDWMIIGHNNGRRVWETWNRSEIEFVRFRPYLVWSHGERVGE